MLQKSVITYGVHKLDLTAAGKHKIAQLQGVLRFHIARSSGGVMQPQASLDIRLGTSNEQSFPLVPGQAIYADSNIECNISWPAQSGIGEAFIIVSADRLHFDLDSTAPVLQVVGDKGATISFNNLNPPVSPGPATVLVAANVSRKRVLIQNHGSDPFWIGGDPTVGAGTGLKIEPGETWESTTTVAAIYGIANVSTALARTWEELA